MQFTHLRFISNNVVELDISKLKPGLRCTAVPVELRILLVTQKYIFFIPY